MVLILLHELNPAAVDIDSMDLFYMLGSISLSFLFW